MFFLTLPLFLLGILIFLYSVKSIQKKYSLQQVIFYFVRLVGDPNVNYTRNKKWWKIEWTEFHFVLLFGLGGFFIFWTFLLLRYDLLKGFDLTLAVVAKNLGLCNFLTNLFL